MGEPAQINGKSVIIYNAIKSGKREDAPLMQRVAGGLAATVFTSAYILAPVALLLMPVLACMRPWSWYTWALALPVVVSAIFPPYGSADILRTWPFKYMPQYFNYSEIKEISDDAVAALVSKRAVIFSVQPHGVLTFGGACAAVEWAGRWWDPNRVPTAVASVLLYLPLVKHIVGLFGIVDASARSLEKLLSKKKLSAVLYIGGIAELFMTSEKKEVLFARNRKGFIKMALRTGAEIVPVYFFGNTSVLSVISNPTLRSIARHTGVTLTFFWGRWFSLVPRPNKLLGVLGTPLGIPEIPDPNPSQEKIDEYHKKYLEEVRRLFETYKKYNPDYKDKILAFE